jgi:hypothetical protein
MPKFVECPPQTAIFSSKTRRHVNQIKILAVSSKPKQKYDSNSHPLIVTPETSGNTPPRLRLLTLHAIEQLKKPESIDLTQSVPQTGRMLQSCFLNRSWFISFKRTLVSFLVFFLVLAAGQESRGISGFPHRFFQVRGGSFFVTHHQGSAAWYPSRNSRTDNILDIHLAKKSRAR